MNDRIIRPSMKQVKAWYACAVLVMVAAVVVQAKYLTPKEQPPWLPIAAVLILFIPIRRHIHRRTIKVTITGDKLRYESGMLSKITRNIQLSKVQDVRVDQSLAQRIIGVGDLSIETSGEASRLEVDNVDQPQAVADEIIAASQQHGSTQAGGGRP
jgi:putative membrane protein